MLKKSTSRANSSAIKAAEALKAEGAEIVRVVTVLDRQEGAEVAFAAAGLPFAAILKREDFRSEG